MIQAEENLSLREVHQERYKIAAPAQNFRMIFFRDAVHSQVDLRPRGHAHGHFLAQKKVRVFAEGFRGVNGIMVGQGDDGHAEALAAFIDLGGSVIGLLGDPGQPRRVAHP